MIKLFIPKNPDVELIKRNGSMCPIPWIHFVSYPSGSAQICTHQSDNSVELGNLFYNSFEEILNHETIRKLRIDMLSGKKNSLCSNCHIFEKADNGISSRTYYLEEFEHLISDSISNTNEQGFIDIRYFKFAYWQFKLSGVCNFKCRTCHFSFSTSIFHEQKKHGWIDEKEILLFNIAKQNMPMVMTNILEHIKSAEKVHFVGGEPIFMVEHWQILDELIKHSRLDVKLSYHTNLSALTFRNKHIFDYWRKFTGLLWISPSVDAYDKKNAYIRDGAIWKDFNNNLDELGKLKNELPNLYIHPTVTVSIFNILYLDELVEYLLTKKINQINFNIVRYPKFYHLSLIPDNLKLLAISKLDNCAEKNGLDKELFNILKIELYNEDNLNLQKELLNLFKLETIKLDLIRKQDFKELFPELCILLE